MLQNPKCPECGHNKRVIFSRKQARGSFRNFGLFVFGAGGVRNYQCNECRAVFAGRQGKVKS